MLHSFSFSYTDIYSSGVCFLAGSLHSCNAEKERIFFDLLKTGAGLENQVLISDVEEAKGLPLENIFPGSCGWSVPGIDEYRSVSQAADFSPYADFLFFCPAVYIPGRRQVLKR